MNRLTWSRDCEACGQSTRHLRQLDGHGSQEGGRRTSAWFRGWMDSVQNRESNGLPVIVGKRHADLIYSRSVPHIQQLGEATSKVSGEIDQSSPPIFRGTMKLERRV